MHGYCSEYHQEECRKKVTRWLVVLSVLFTPVVNHLLNSLLLLTQNVRYIGDALKYLTSNGVSFAVSYIGLFSVLNVFWGHLLWKKRFVAKWHQIPNLSGMWSGKLHSNYDGGREIDMEMHIKQTWTEIECKSIFADSSSSSQMARVYMRNDKETRLEFAFSNVSIDPKVVQRYYYGYNWFAVRDNIMTGCYFTDRECAGTGSSNKTAGSMELKKVCTQKCILKNGTFAAKRPNIKN